jgi:hypothetical protein
VKFDAKREDHTAAQVTVSAIAQDFRTAAGRSFYAAKTGA